MGTRRIVVFASLVAALAAALSLGTEQPGGRGAPAALASPARAGPTGVSAGAAFVHSLRRRRAVVWAVGDGAEDDLAGMPVANLIGSRRVHRFLYLGDVYNYGTAAEFEQNYEPVFGRFDPIAAPTIGNHEYENRATGYDPYWTAARGRPTPPWYSFSVAGWQFLSLNAMEPAGEGTQQLDWLRRRLAQTPRFGSCRVAFMHFPRYSAGPDGGTHGDHPELRALWGELAGRARMFLAGHNHHMERRSPVDGITQLISGAGGHELSNADESDPGAAFVEDELHGALRLRLRRGFAQASFIGVDGALLDMAPIACRRAG